MFIDTTTKVQLFLSLWGSRDKNHGGHQSGTVADQVFAQAACVGGGVGGVGAAGVEAMEVKVVVAEQV